MGLNLLTKLTFFKVYAGLIGKFILLCPKKIETLK